MSSTGFRDSLDEKSKANLVQIKGRFSMTSEDLDILKDIPLSTIPRRSLKPAPREINTTSQNGKLPPLPRSAENNGSVKKLVRGLTTEKSKYVQVVLLNPDPGISSQLVNWVRFFFIETHSFKGFSLIPLDDLLTNSLLKPFVSGSAMLSIDFT
ncbi:hypothetical protein Tco_0357471 [Tanacetum coccineum]